MTSAARSRKANPHHGNLNATIASFLASSLLSTIQGILIRGITILRKTTRTFMSVYPNHNGLIEFKPFAPRWTLDLKRRGIGFQAPIAEPIARRATPRQQPMGA
jgi:hypothetical protein